VRYVVFGAPIGLLLAAIVVVILQGSGLLPAGLWRSVGIVAFVLCSLGLTLFWLIGQAEYQLNNAEEWVRLNERIPPLRLRAPRAMRGSRLVP
jgi:hypothetical protein